MGRNRGAETAPSVPDLARDVLHIRASPRLQRLIGSCASAFPGSYLPGSTNREHWEPFLTPGFTLAQRSAGFVKRLLWTFVSGGDLRARQSGEKKRRMAKSHAPPLRMVQLFEYLRDHLLLGKNADIHGYYKTISHVVQQRGMHLAGAALLSHCIPPTSSAISNVLM